MVDVSDKKLKATIKHLREYSAAPISSGVTGKVDVRKSL
jgi:hypothetical protein